MDVTEGVAVARRLPLVLAQGREVLAGHRQLSPLTKAACLSSSIQGRTLELLDVCLRTLKLRDKRMNLMRLSISQNVDFAMQLTEREISRTFEMFR